ncbi:MAG: glutathione S-transferase family protein [Halieaceae bacterium]|nr:glutathione S-transferase family protein [Halieaceae bacterium]
MMILHGASASPFVRKVLVALKIKGLSYEQLQQMPFTKDEEYRRLNPLGKIPTLQDGALTICDSTVICEYLEDSQSEPPLYPRDSSDRAMARWYEELGGTRIAELAAGIFFQRFMRPMVLKQEPDEELVEKIISKQLPPLLDYLEAQVPESGYLFGDFMIADMSLMSPFVNAAYAGYELDAGRWPCFSGFVERVKAHPVVHDVLQDEAAIMGRG